MIKQIKLGRTNIICGEIGLGCEGFCKMSIEECKKVIDLGIENGANFIDLYASNPVTRSNIGKAIFGKRDKVYIQGHLCTKWENEQYARTRNLEEAKKSFSDLLARLQTNYIDVGMIHYIDEEKDFNEVFNGEIIKYALSLKEQGFIKYLGVSSHNPIVAKKMAQTGLIDVIMFSVNPCYDLLPPSEDCDLLFDAKSYEINKEYFDKDRIDFYEYCGKEDIAITVMKAFAGGDLLSDELSPFKKAMTPIQCMAYPFTKPGVKVVLSGFHTLEQFQKDLEYQNASNEDKDFSAVLKNCERYNFNGHCVYCGHCAPCVKSIDIATVNKYLDLCIAQNEVPETVLNHYQLLNHKASECIKCGQCSKRCPFGVDIVKKMEHAVKLFGN